MPRMRHDPRRVFGSDGRVGPRYERATAAVYVAALLTDTAGPGLTGPVRHVGAQQKAALDDLEIGFDAGHGQTGLLRLQLKHDLKLTESTSNDDFAAIIADSWHVLLDRHFQQLRLIFPGSGHASRKPARRDGKLVALVAEAHQARQLVSANPDKSIASLAREQGRCRTRLGKLIGLSCLAPDIVTAIVEGRQPEQLTAARLASAQLPLAWIDQRHELGFS